MTQHYSDPERESDPHALPDVEVFYHDKRDGGEGTYWWNDEINISGWYWWSCFPGCLPDSDPVGPFETEQEAVADAQSA